MRINNFPSNVIGHDVTVSVHKLITDVLGSRQKQLSDSKVALETDLCSVAAVVNKQQLHSVVNALIDHSLNSMPLGGQLSITLLTDDRHWELEVADSSGVDPVRMMSWSERDQHQSLGPAQQSNQPHIASAANFELAAAQEMVSEHSGQLQTWNCPQGGTARVIVMPYRERLNEPINSEQSLL